MTPRVPSLANVTALLVALCIEKGPCRSSGVRVTTFSSAGRPPPLVRAEEVSAPLEGSIRTTRRAPMYAEVERLGLQTSGEGQRGQGRPSPPPDQFSSSTQFDASTRARRENCATFVNDCKAVCILENVAGRNDEDTTTHCSVSKKWIRLLLDHSDDGMER